MRRKLLLMGIVGAMGVAPLARSDTGPPTNVQGPLATLHPQKTVTFSVLEAGGGSPRVHRPPGGWGGWGVGRRRPVGKGHASVFLPFSGNLRKAGSRSRSAAVGPLHRSSHRQAVARPGASLACGHNGVGGLVTAGR